MKRSKNRSVSYQEKGPTKIVPSTMNPFIWNSNKVEVQIYYYNTVRVSNDLKDQSIES